MAPNRSHRRDLAGSGRGAAATPELGEPPGPEVGAAAPFFESFFFFDDILTTGLYRSRTRIYICACGYSLLRVT